MTGVSVTVEIDDKRIRASLRSMMERMENPLGFYEEVGQELLDIMDRNFETESDPDGIPWKKLLPSTVWQKRRRGSGGGILSDQGHLKGSINIRPTSEQVSIGSPMEYAAIHQLGGTIKKPARKAVLFLKRNARTGEIGHRFVERKKSNVVQDVTIPAHTITIPARPYIGIGANDVDSIIKIANTWLSDG